MATTATLTEGGGGEGAPQAPPACLYLVLQAHRPLAPSERWPLDELDEVTVGRGAERSAERGERRLAVKLPDGWMSSSHAVLRRLYDRWVVEDAGSKNGTLVNGAPAERVVLADGDLVEAGHSFFLFRSGGAAAAPRALDAEAAALPVLHTFVGPLAVELAALAEVARATLPVLVRGETGTGKELIVRAVHKLSRRGGPLVAVNCAALPTTLVESELFGSKRGAFSGATEDRPGLVRASDGGTLFLDEIGDLPLPAQGALLRVLQEREVQPIGATRPTPVDLRLVAATHRDLDALAADGRFRPDLLARLSGFTLRLPPLRERIEDLGTLTAELLRRAAPERAETIALSAEAARALLRHRWPMNVRELERCLLGAAVLARQGDIEAAHLPDEVRAALSERPAAPQDDQLPELTREESARREELVALLREHHGSVSAVARAMGKARMQIQRWVKRYRLNPADYK